MICCAVGICEITDLKREKNSVATSNSPASKRARIFSRDASALLEAERADGAQVDDLDDALAELPAQDVEALLADADDLDVLAVGEERGWRARGRAARSRS